MRFAVIIPAAGSGSRSGRDIPKQYVELIGAPVLAHTIGAFTTLENCGEVVVAIDEAWRELAERCAPSGSVVRFVHGGAERQDSVAAALAALSPTEEIVLVHDAARPCVSRELVERVVAAAAEHGAALPVLPVSETVKRVDRDGQVIETVPRSELRLAQTPQGFRREVIERAYAEALRRGGAPATDDAALAEAIGTQVWTVIGDPANLKITMPQDFARAETILKLRR